MERKLSSLHIVALIATSLIFLLGLLIGWQLGYTAESQMKAEFEGIRSESNMLEVLSLLRERGEAECPLLEKSFADLTKRTEEYGASLDYMEKKLGKLDPEVMRLKSEYSVMQARNYLLLREIEDECLTDPVIIVYFYTNDEYSKGTDQGIALADALSGLPAVRDRARVYHFDVNVKSPIIDALKEQYGVKAVPTTIINGKKHEGFLDAQKAREIISRES